MKSILQVSVILLASATALSAQVSLLDNSPFLPPPEPGAGTGDEGPVSQSLNQLEFRGVTALDGQYIFSIYNKQTRESRWMSEGLEEDGLVIRSWDANKMSIIIYSSTEDIAREIPILDFSFASESPVATTNLNQAPDPIHATPSNDPNKQERPTRDNLRPTRRNLETLRQRRQELAERLKARAKE